MSSLIGHAIDDADAEDSITFTCAEQFIHSCFEVRTYRLCRRILMFHHFPELGIADYLVGSTDITYNENTTATYLQSVVQAGYTLDSTGKSYVRKALPPIEFGYSMFPTDDELSRLVVQEVDSASLENLPIGLDGLNYQWVDLDGEGLSGLLTDQGGCWYYKRNSSANNIVANGVSMQTSKDEMAKARFDALEIISMKPSISATGGQAHFGDVSGAGKLDLIQTGIDTWGHYERNDPDGWLSLQTFQTFPSIDINNPDVKYVDLTGDGLADILICADQVYYWHRNKWVWTGADSYTA